MNRPFQIGENTVRGIVLGLLLGATLLAGIEKLTSKYEEALTQIASAPAAADDPHPFLLWDLPPGETLVNGQSIQVNNVGARGPEVQQTKADNARRILFLGDSVAFGESLDLDDTFSIKCVDALGGARVGIEGVLMAVPDYTVLQHRNLMSMRGWKLSPDLLVITGPGIEMSVSRYVDKEVISHFRSTDPTRARLEKFAIFRVLDHLIRVGHGKTAAQRQQVFKSGVHANQMGRPRVGTNLFASTLELLTTEAIDRDVEVVFIILPLPADLNNGHLTDRVHLYRTAMINVANRLGIPVVDGPSVFKKSVRSSEQLFLGPRLLTEYGHRVLGQALSKKLRPWMRGRPLIGQGIGGVLPTLAEPENFMSDQ
jgi:hypothetical protein